MRTKPRKADDRVTGESELSLASTDELNVGLMVRHAFRAFSRVLQEVTSPFGLTAAEFRVMRALATSNALTQVGMAALVGMDRPYATLIAKRLREKGLVESAADSRDKRRVAMILTPRGAEITSEIADQLAQANRAAIKGVQPNDLKAFVAVCSQITTNLAAADPADLSAKRM